MFTATKTALAALAITFALPSLVGTAHAASVRQDEARDVTNDDIGDDDADAGAAAAPSGDAGSPQGAARAAAEPAAPDPSAKDVHEPRASARPGETAALVTAAPRGSDDDDGADLTLRPYLLVVGGVKGDVVKDRPEETKQDRVATFALGRLGLKARWRDLVSAESELMASGGFGLHGTSAFEGQAALQVRQQVIRLHHGVFRLEAGRFIDEASVDYFSAHVAESFLQDTATRDPLLFSGFNLGNGVRGELQLVPGVRAALTLNAGNPVSTTSSLMIGGAFSPFERFYTQPYQQVNQGPNHFPDDTFHIMVLSPSVLVDTTYVDARFEVQGFDVNTNMNREDDDHIRGYNVRGSVRAKIAGGAFMPFASVAYTRNDTLVPNDLATRAPERYHALNYGGGFDVGVSRRYRCAWDCADGFGVQYQQVQYQVGDQLVTTNNYANIGATYWLAPYASLGGRLAYWATKQEGSAQTGETSAIVSLRFIMN